MSDGEGDARRERQWLEEWLVDKGWSREKVGSVTIWSDPLSPNSAHWLQEAVKIQQSREEAVEEVMES